jgi:hypothetical protein
MPEVTRTKRRNAPPHSGPFLPSACHPLCSPSALQFLSLAFCLTAKNGILGEPYLIHDGDEVLQCLKFIFSPGERFHPGLWGITIPGRSV